MCAVVEACQISSEEYARKAILDDAIWLRLFNVYLQKSDEAKGKSMRQMLLLLTSTITKDQSQRAMELRARATTTFLEIICARQDRLKVKPALQGLAHFLLRDVVPISKIITIFSTLQGKAPGTVSIRESMQMMFHAILAWVVHHDTSLSAGHLIKNFLLQARKTPEYNLDEQKGSKIPLWIIPTTEVLQFWPDRMQEFKTHVFPYCFLPYIEEYQHFLTYLRFSTHVKIEGTLPDELRSAPNLNNGLSKGEEFQILLAALETGKQLTILRDTGK